MNPFVSLRGAALNRERVEDVLLAVLQGMCLLGTLDGVVS